MHSARYRQALRCYQARKVRRRDFSEGDLVLRLRQDNRGRHKLSPPWEGPYVVVKVLKPGTYKLANEDGEELTLGTSSSYVASTLSEDFQVICCKLHAQHPSWQFRCKYQRVNKVKGQLGSPQKTKLPSGLLQGAPPRKNGPIFSQKFASAPTTPRHLNLRQTQAERERPSGKDARAGDSPRLQQDTTFLPRLQTSGSFVKSKLSTPDLPKSRKRAAERRGKRNKDSVSIYKILQTNSYSLHGHEARMLTSKKGLTPSGP
jgi:hypothetical protein